MYMSCFSKRLSEICSKHKKCQKIYRRNKRSEYVFCFVFLQVMNRSQYNHGWKKIMLYSKWMATALLVALVKIEAIIFSMDSRFSSSLFQTKSSD